MQPGIQSDDPSPHAVEMPRTTGGYPLIALFLLITACGIVAALIGPAVRAVAAGKIGTMEAIWSALIGTGVVMIVGSIVGIFHYRRARGFAWGLAVGAVIGLFAGPLVLVPREAFGTVLALSLGGSLVIVLMSAVFRISGRK